MKDSKQKLWQAATYLLCIIITWRNPYGLYGEFSGGRVTGRLLDSHDVGGSLFVVALFLTFPYRRIAAATAIFASFLCAPLYLYFLAPGPFRWVFRGEYSVPLGANFVWNSWAVESMFALAFATCVSLFVLRRTGNKEHG